MISIDHQACNGCGLCIESCPTCALRLVDGLAQLDEHLCQGCEICIDVCPQGAITVSEVIEDKYPVVVRATPLSERVLDKGTVLDYSSAKPLTQRSVEVLTKPQRSLGEWLGAALVFLVRDIAPAIENLMKLRDHHKADTTLTQHHFVESTRGNGPSGRRGGRRVRRRQRRR